MTAAAAYTFASTSTSCSSTSSDLLAQFLNNASPHNLSPLTILCSVDPTSLNSGILVEGDLHATGPIYSNSALVAPTYTTSGGSAASTFHCVYGTVTAPVGATSVTISLTSAAIFATAPVEVAGINGTSGTVIPTTAFTSVGTSSVTFTVTAGDTYDFHFCGF